MDKSPVILQREIAFKCSPEFMKRRARRYLSRSSFRLIVIISVILYLIGGAGLVFDHRPGRSAYCLLFLPTIPALLKYLFAYLSLSRVRHDNMNRQIIARIEAESLSIVAGGITTTLHWWAIKRLWKFPDLFLLFTEKRRPVFVTLPVSELADETKTFIEAKIREHGGEVA
jgi:hypothetical protein